MGIIFSMKMEEVLRLAVDVGVSDNEVFEALKLLTADGNDSYPIPDGSMHDSDVVKKMEWMDEKLDHFKDS